MAWRKKKIKYHGVRKGHVLGIYNDWLEAQEQVSSGFPGAEVQSFTNKIKIKGMNKSTDTKSTFIQAGRCACQEEMSEEKLEHIQTDNMRQMPNPMKST